MSEGESKNLQVKDIIQQTSTTAMNMFSYLGQVGLSHLSCL